MIYLDNASTTKPAMEVVDAINSILIKEWYNPSGSYSSSVRANEALTEARKVIAESINASPDEIIFVSSGSEANNLAVKGFFDVNKDYGLITDRFSHSSVRSIKHWRYYLKNNRHGFIYNYSILETIEKMSLIYNLKPFFSIVGANNEFGTIQNIKHISQIIHNHNGILHVDAVQLYPEMKIDVKKFKIDMMSVSGHKFGCPPGVGFLYVRKGIKISPIISGQQEYSLRGGTENLAYIHSMSVAVNLIDYNENSKIKIIRDYAIDKLLEIEDSYLVGSREHRLSNNINICFRGIDSSSLILYLDNYGICVNNGSACNSSSYEPSKSLKALGMSDNDAHSCVRITLGKDSTVEEIDYLCKIIKQYCDVTKGQYY